MEGARRYIAGATCASDRPLPGRTLLGFSRTEHPSLRWYSGVRRRPWMDRQHLVAATGRRPRPDHPLRNARLLFLVLLLPRISMVAGGNSFTQPGIRLRALPRQPHLVLGTGLHRGTVSPALRA